MSRERDSVYSTKFSVVYAEEDSHGGHQLSSGGMPNRNTEWLENKYTRLSYVFVVSVIGVVLFTSQLMSLADAATTLNIAHGLVTFIFFHWIKGSPDEFSQGEWNGLTFWEQLDAGIAWTPIKKYLIIVPCILCLISLGVSNYSMTYVFINVPVCVILIVAKMPGMHRVRIMSINATPGIDDFIEGKDK